MTTYNCYTRICNKYIIPMLENIKLKIFAQYIYKIT
ncbi:hypothetical protein Q5M85_18990 [Paraclostridium bifermentans]|nr:hypothetical protein [Paraclostridium bifermentans]